MSTKVSLWWSEAGHLYFDYADEAGVPHAYLRIDRGLATFFEVRHTPRGVSITVRLPGELLPILRPEIEAEALALGRPPR